MSHNFDRLEAAKFKIQRANRHIADFEQLCKRFFENDACTVFRIDHPDRGYQIFARLNHRVPQELSIIAGEAAGQLRSAFDKLVGALAVMNGKTAAGVKFPFGGDAGDAFPSARDEAVIKKLTPDQRELVFAQQPHLRGDQLLWAINRLANTDKHGDGLIKVATGASFSHGTLGFEEPTDCEIENIFLSISGPGFIEIPLNQDVELLTVFARPAPKFHGGLGFGIVFNDIEPICEKPVIETLHQMSRLTERIIDTFERAFF